MDALQMAAQMVLFILPSYFANSIPVVLGGGKPIDGGRKLPDGNRLFGDGKTNRGFAAGVLAGLFVGAAEGIILPGTGFALYPSASGYVYAGFLLGLGTMAGDLVGSFVKRRQGMAQGKPSVVMDQLSFLIFALLFAYPVASRLITLELIVSLAILTYFVHVAANVLAHRAGLKKVPW